MANTMKASKDMAPLAKRKELRVARHAENRELMGGFSHADFLKDVAARDLDLAAGGTGDGEPEPADETEMTDEQKAAAAAAAAGTGWNAGTGVSASAPVKATSKRRANT